MYPHHVYKLDQSRATVSWYPCSTVGMLGASPTPTGRYGIAIDPVLVARVLNTHPDLFNSFRLVQAMSTAVGMAAKVYLNFETLPISQTVLRLDNAHV